MSPFPKTTLIKPSSAHHTCVAAQTLNSITARADYFLRGTQNSDGIVLEPKPQQVKQNSGMCFDHNASFVAVDGEDGAQALLFCDKSVLVRIRQNNLYIYFPTPLRLTSKAPKSLGFELGEKLSVGHLGWRSKNTTPSLCLSSRYWPNGDGTAINLMANTWVNRTHINGDVNALKTLLVKEISQLGKAALESPTIFPQNHLEADTPEWLNLRDFTSKDFDILKAFAFAWREKYAPEFRVKVTSAMQGSKGFIFPLVRVYNENLTVTRPKLNKQFQSDLERFCKNTDIKVLAQKWVVDRHLSPPSRMRPTEQYDITPQTVNPFTKHQQMMAQAHI